MSARPLFGALARSNLRCFCTRQDFAANDLVQQVPEGELILGLQGERITANFDFYAAFQMTAEFIIRCGPHEIGNCLLTGPSPVGEHLLLAGKRWVVTEIIFKLKLVLVTLSRGKKPIRFLGAAGEIHTRVLQEMKTALMNNDEPAYLDQNGKLLLSRPAKRLVSSELDKTDVVFGGKAFIGFRRVGTRALLTLQNSSPNPQTFPANRVIRFRSRINFPSAEEFFAHLREISNSQPDPITLASTYCR